MYYDVPIKEKSVLGEYNITTVFQNYKICISFINNVMVGFSINQLMYLFALESYK